MVETADSFALSLKRDRRGVRSGKYGPATVMVIPTGKSVVAPNGRALVIRQWAGGQFTYDLSKPEAKARAKAHLQRLYRVHTRMLSLKASLSGAVQ